MKLSINQDIFESIVDMANNGHYKTHHELRKAILMKSAKPKQAALLKNLDRASQEHTLITRGVPTAAAPRTDASPNANAQDEIRRLQALVLSIQQGATPDRRQRPRTKSTQRCYDHAEGKCKRGEACRFVHEGAAGSGPEAPRNA